MIPTSAALGPEVLDVAVTGSSRCVLLHDASVWCWGSVDPYALGGTALARLPLQARELRAYLDTIYLTALDGGLYRLGPFSLELERVTEGPVTNFSVEVDRLCVIQGQEASCRWFETPTEELPSRIKFPASDPAELGTAQGYSCLRTEGRTLQCAVGRNPPQEVMREIEALRAFDGLLYTLNAQGKIAAMGPHFPERPDPVETTLFFSSRERAKSLSLTDHGLCATYETGLSRCLAPFGVSASAVPDTSAELLPGLTELRARGETDLGCRALAGELYCWGTDRFGALGPYDLTSPPEVRFGRVGLGELGSLDHIVDFSFMGSSACAVTWEGTLLCWGENEFGELGMTDRSRLLFPEAPSLLELQQQKVKSVTMSDRYACTISRDDRLLCFGSPRWLDAPGLKGKRAHDSSGGGAPGVFLRASDISNVSAGSNHLCALTTAGQALCLGTNSHGELGNGSTQGTEQLGPVLDERGLPLERVTRLRVFATHSCAVRGGELLCFGQNVPGSQARPFHSPARFLKAHRVELPWEVKDVGASLLLGANGELYAFGAPTATDPYRGYEPRRIGECNVSDLVGLAGALTADGHYIHDAAASGSLPGSSVRAKLWSTVKMKVEQRKMLRESNGVLCWQDEFGNLACLSDTLDANEAFAYPLWTALESTSSCPADPQRHELPRFPPESFIEVTGRRVERDYSDPNGQKFRPAVLVRLSASQVERILQLVNERTTYLPHVWGGGDAQIAFQFWAPTGEENARIEISENTIQTMPCAPVQLAFGGGVLTDAARKKLHELVLELGLLGDGGHSPVVQRAKATDRPAH